MYQLYTKFKSLKGVLKIKNVECYGDIQQKVLQARVRLELAQQAVLSSFGRR